MQGHSLPIPKPFELSGRGRQDARLGLLKMYSVLPDRAWWPAAAAPLERGFEWLVHKFTPLEQVVKESRRTRMEHGLTPRPFFR